MENEKKAMVVAQLNIDVISEILSRLRVKDLIRFKCVCKSWFQVISSNDFIKLHLQRSSSRPIALDHGSFYIDCNRVRSRRVASRFCGSSCDGLVCLLDQTNGIIHIWNPALRSSACITMKKCPRRIRCVWFGLHNGDYTLVLGTHELEMHVVRPYVESRYDCKSMKNLLDGSHTICYKVGIPVNGIVHWPVFKWLLNGKYWSILSYDLHLEKVDEIALPVKICLCKKINEELIRLGEVDGNLAAFFRNEQDCVEIWVMGEYGVRESWTMLMILDTGDQMPATMKAPLHQKDTYVESLVFPRPRYTERSLRNHNKFCQIT